MGIRDSYYIYDIKNNKSHYLYTYDGEYECVYRIFSFFTYGFAFINTQYIDKSHRIHSILNLVENSVEGFNLQR